MRIETSAEVWAVIKARHHADLHVFVSYSEPDGEHGSNNAVMYTAYGLKGADFLLMTAETRWDIDDERSSKRHNERTQYWLMVNEQAFD